MTLHCPECGCVIRETAQRSWRTHNHYFAALHEAWVNLPEKIAGEFRSPEHLRKFALIKAGYCTTHKIVCGSAKEAQEASMLVARLDEFAICQVFDAVLTVYRAKSQSYRSMGKEEFAKSKEDVLGVLSEMVGADVSLAAIQGGAA